MIGSLIKSLFGGSESEVEIPEWMGEILSSDYDLLKGAGHKYIRRIPTGNPKKPWRYFYKVSGGSGLGHHSEFVEGAAFKVAHNGKEGHFHILGVEGDKLKIKHDETGEESTLTKDALTSLLHKEHAKAIGEHKERLKKELVAVSKHGSEKQKAKIQSEANKAGVSAVKDPFDDLLSWNGLDASESDIYKLAEIAAANKPFDFSDSRSDEYKQSMDRFNKLYRQAGKARAPSTVPTRYGNRDFTKATSEDIYRDILFYRKDRQRQEAGYNAENDKTYEDLRYRYQSLIESLKKQGIHAERRGGLIDLMRGPVHIHTLEPGKETTGHHIDRAIQKLQEAAQEAEKKAKLDGFLQSRSTAQWRSGSLGKSGLALDRDNLIHKPTGAILLLGPSAGIGKDTIKKIGSRLHAAIGDLPNTLDEIKADPDKVSVIRWVQENADDIARGLR